MTDGAQLECDMLAQIIRTVDGENKLGAGALAEAILAHCSLPMQDRDALAARLEEAECDLKDLQDRIEVKGGGADAPTQWAYEQACTALQHHKERAGVKDQQLHIARESLLSIAKCADDEDSQETAKNALVIMRVLEADQ